jgi:hypothetical protein
MDRHRIIRTAALAAIALCVQVVPASASSTLLSGYGGPGQGNQAILGSTLVGGGGSGGAGTGGGGQTAAAPSSIALPSGSGGAAGTPGAGRASHPAKGAGRATRTSGSAQPAYTPATASSDRSGGGRTLGLTGGDVAYIVLAFGLLALTAVLTSRLAGRAWGTGPGKRTESG